MSGLVVGLVVVTMVSSGNQSEPAPYQPFLAGRDDRIERRITEKGPVFYPDPRRGTRAFYLDVVDGDIVALHVVPPNGTADCLVQWDGQEKRYESCEGKPVDPATLDRFLVTTQPAGENQAILVDVRTTQPGPG